MLTKISVKKILKINKIAIIYNKKMI